MIHSDCEYIMELVHVYLVETEEEKFDELLHRINEMEDTLAQMQTAMQSIAGTIHALLDGAEQRRISDMASIKQEFNQIICNLRNQMHNDIQSMTDQFEEQQLGQNEKLERMEEQILYDAEKMKQ